MQLSDARNAFTPPTNSSLNLKSPRQVRDTMTWYREARASICDRRTQHISESISSFDHDHLKTAFAAEQPRHFRLVRVVHRVSRSASLERLNDS